MLNELAIATKGLKDAKIPFAAPNPHIQPAVKNRRVVIVRVAADGKPASLELTSKEQSSRLLRFVLNTADQASPTFPCFNVPVPLRCLGADPSPELAAALKRLAELQKKKGASIPDLVQAARSLFDLSEVRSFSDRETDRFRRCIEEIPHELKAIVATAGTELMNLRHLVDILSASPHSLTDFTDHVARLLVNPMGDFARDELLFFQGLLFGPLDWRGREAEIGSPAYVTEKFAKDEGSRAVLYIELAQANSTALAVSHPKTWERLGELLDVSDGGEEPKEDRDGLSQGICAFSGEFGDLEKAFSPPKLARLGPFKPFSLNTTESKCLLRYGLRKNASFPVGKRVARDFYNVLLYLGSERQLGVSCKPVKNGRVRRIQGRTVEEEDLLVAYLEQAPNFSENLAELFGGEAPSPTDADFAARTKPVLEALKGKLTEMPDLSVRVLALCSLNEGQKQISLHRQFRVQDIVRAATSWEKGAENGPPVSIRFERSTADLKIFPVPDPLDVARVINQVWAADPEQGFRSKPQRAVMNADAFDVFIGQGALAGEKARDCLTTLLARTSVMLGALGAVKTSREWRTLSESVRWHCAKTIALVRIFLQQLGQTKDTFMKEPVYHLGQLLALADSLHQQYCEHVRGGKAPTQLIGNALFSTALEQPVFALARLAERLPPYQAWAKNFKNTDPNVKSGWEKVVLRLLRERASRFIEDVDGTFRIRADELPQRMTDLDKAKLLLGYLADSYEPETEKSNAQKQ